MLNDSFFSAIKQTEADLQFLLGQKLQDAGFHVYFEQTFKLPAKANLKTSNRGKPQRIRVDIVLVKSGAIKGFIEVKNYTKPSYSKTRQRRKYQEMGVPYCFCWNENFIDKTVEWAKSL